MCLYCGATPFDGALLHADHVHPRRHGGKDIAGNLATACADCNCSKSERVLSGRSLTYIESVVSANCQRAGLDPKTHIYVP